jgi:hypothetical protein
MTTGQQLTCTPGSISRVHRAASHVSPGSNSRVIAGSDSRVTGQQLMCKPHVSCRCRGDFQVCFSGEIKTFSGLILQVRLCSTDTQVVPRLRRGASFRCMSMQQVKNSKSSRGLMV